MLAPPKQKSKKFLTFLRKGSILSIERIFGFLEENDERDFAKSGLWQSGRNVAADSAQSPAKRLCLFGFGLARLVSLGELWGLCPAGASQCNALWFADRSGVDSVLFSDCSDAPRNRGRRGIQQDGASYRLGSADLRHGGGRGGRRRFSSGSPLMKNRIKERRKAIGYRQQDLAEALGVSRQTIVAIENDKYNPTLELAMRLARYLGIPVEELFQLE